MVRRILMILLLSVSWATAWSATIEAHLDRNPVSLNESFQLSFDVQGDQDGEPDFSPLETFFDILNRSQSSRIQIVNGNMTRSKQYELTLMAREPGNYTIPAIAFGEDRSNPLALEVGKEVVSSNEPGGPLFLETELTPRKTYVQAQLLYTVRLLRSVNLRSGSLSEPKLSGVEAMVEKLGEDHGYDTMRNGVRYTVVERRYAIYPQQSGTLTLEPTVFQGQILEGSRFAFNDVLKSKRLSSERYQVTVLPVPAHAPHPWLPSEELRLVEEWPQDPPRFTVGEPVTRTLTLMAKGLTAAQLPELATQLPGGIKAYPDQPLLKDDTQQDGLTGIRQEKIALMPTRPGRFTLPAIEIPWWNITTGQQEIARIPARSIDVIAAGDTAPPPVSLPAEPAPVAPPTTTPAPSSMPHDKGAGLWPWLSLLLALGWGVTALAWWLGAHRPRGMASRAPHSGFRPVQRACKRNDAAACKTALLHWAASRWPEQPPTSLGAIAGRVDTEFATALQELSRCLYAPHPDPWNGASLLQAAEQWRRKAAAKAPDHGSVLASLHPQR